MKAWLAMLLLLTGCEGSGCTPGDYIAQCGKTCGVGNVAQVSPGRDVCICREFHPNETVAL
jgi:hypothetical protein